MRLAKLSVLTIVTAAMIAGPARRMPTRAVQIRAGQVDVNAAPFNPRTPFGGYKHFGI